VKPFYARREKIVSLVFFFLWARRWNVFAIACVSIAENKKIALRHLPLAPSKRFIALDESYA